jgi:hypothetical protein
VHRSRVEPGRAGPDRAGPGRVGPRRAKGLLRALKKDAPKHSKVRTSLARAGPGRAQRHSARGLLTEPPPRAARSVLREGTRRSQSGAGGHSPQRAGPAGAPGPLATAGRGLLAAAADTSWRAETQPGRGSPCPRPLRRGPICVRKGRWAGRGPPARAGGGGGGDVVVGGDATRAAQWRRRRWRLALPAAAAKTDWLAETPPGSRGRTGFQ